jgi:flagellar assembly protein FliH
MSSSERAWAPPALTREFADPARSSASGGWLLADLGGPASALVPADASYEAGYADGLRDGVRQAGDHLRPALQALSGVVQMLGDRAAEILGDRQRDLQALALAVARRLVQREVTADPRLLADWIARAVEMLPNDLQVHVRLHPEDLELLGELRDTVVPPDAGVAVHWSADASVGRAGFVVESPQRLVDGRLDMALRVLYERFEKE